MIDQEAHVVDEADDTSPVPPSPPPPPGDVYQLLAALADRVEELEAERAETRQRLGVVAAALTRLADDEYQPPGARHVAQVIGRQLAPLLGAPDDGARGAG